MRELKDIIYIPTMGRVWERLSLSCSADCHIPSPSPATDKAGRCPEGYQPSCTISLGRTVSWTEGTHIPLSHDSPGALDFG